MKKVISFDIGGTNTRIALINEHFEIEKEETIPTKRDSVDAFLSSIDELISHFDLKDVLAFGVGIPGVCNRETGYIYDLPNVHIKDIPLGEFIQNKYIAYLITMPFQIIYCFNRRKLYLFSQKNTC